MVTPSDLNGRIRTFPFDLCTQVIISLITLPFGFVLKKKMKVLSIFITCLFITHLGLHFDFLNVKVNEGLDNKALTKLGAFVVWLGFLTEIICSVTLILRQNTIRSFVEPFLPQVSKKDKLKIIFVFSLCHVTLAIWYCMALAKLVRGDRNSQLNHSTARVIIDFITVIYSMWQVTMPAIYWLLFYLMIFRHKRKLRSMVTFGYETMYDLWFLFCEQIEDDYNQFNRLFSHLPGIWLAYTFMGFAGHIELIFNETISNMFFHIFVDFAPWILSLVAINLHHSSFVSQAKVVERVISLRGKIHDSSKYAIKCLIDEMCHKNKPVSCCIVTLDKTLLLPFLGSVCTFTVLFRDQFLTSSEKRITTNATSETSDSFRW